MTVYADNPAGRLQALLISFEHHSSHKSVLSAWAAALGAPASDLPELFRRLGLVNGLPDQIEAEVGMIDESEYDRDVVVRWRDVVVPVLGAALMTVNPGTSAQLAERLDAESMRSLKACSALLHRHRAEQTIDEAHVQAIREAIGELEDAAESDPDDGLEFRQFLRNHARAMTQAVNDLPIRGFAALAGAFDLAVGAVVHEELRFRKRGYTRRSGWKKFLKMIVVVAAGLSIPLSVVQMPAAVRSDMSPAPPVQVVEEVKVIEVIEEEPSSPQITITQLGKESGQQVSGGLP